MTPTFNAKFSFGLPLQVLERPAAGVACPQVLCSPAQKALRHDHIIYKNCFNGGDSSRATKNYGKYRNWPKLGDEILRPTYF